MSEDDLKRNSKTGDLLLFRSGEENIGGTITRMLTKGYYDHVAMIIRFK